MHQILSWQSLAVTLGSVAVSNKVSLVDCTQDVSRSLYLSSDLYDNKTFLFSPYQIILVLVHLQEQKLGMERGCLCVHSLVQRPLSTVFSVWLTQNSKNSIDFYMFVSHPYYYCYCSLVTIGLLQINHERPMFWDAQGQVK